MRCLSCKSSHWVRAIASVWAVYFRSYVWPGPAHKRFINLSSLGCLFPTVPNIFSIWYGLQKSGFLKVRFFFNKNRLKTKKHRNHRNLHASLWLAASQARVLRARSIHQTADSPAQICLILSSRRTRTGALGCLHIR